VNSCLFRPFIRVADSDERPFLFPDVTDRSWLQETDSVKKVRVVAPILVV
jgi:hypothetical protein